MARYSTPKSAGISKFRMVVIDAELQEGEISQLAQAIQGAFGVQRAALPRLSGPAVNPLSNPDPVELAEQLDTADAVNDAGVAAVPMPSKPKSPRKIRTPNLDGDLHPEVDPSFKAYAEARNVTGGRAVLTKFLIVASWLHEERSGMAITADRAYTCFRFIGWPFNIGFDQPLRDLKRKNKFLAELPAKVPDLTERVFLQEAIKCYKVTAYRAAIVMTWNLAYDHLIRWIFVEPGRVMALNTAFAKRFSKRPPTVAVAEDLETIKEFDVVEACGAAGLLSSNIVRILREKLTKRNMAAHPSALVIDEPQANDVITDLVNNVVLALK